MNSLRVAAIPLPSDDFPSCDAKFQAALQGIDLAARDGAELAVLPELTNWFAGCSPKSTTKLRPENYAISDLRNEIAPFTQLAARLKVAVVLPVLIKARDGYTNSVMFINERGRIIRKYGLIPRKEFFARYRKLRSTL